MNDLSLTLAWTAVRVSLLLVPAVALHAVASRRGPAAGSSVASLGLGLVVALSLAAVFPRGRVGAESAAGTSTSVAATATSPSRASGATAERVAATDRTEARLNESRSVAGGLFANVPGWGVVWERIERAAAAPAARRRPWGGVLAGVFLATAGFGLLRLALGLWAVHLCRRRGRPVHDPGLTLLLKELRAAMGCPRAVEVLEVPDLGSPATAGWRRPMLLLPDDWRAWDEPERRAVLAHELAHVCRGDYITGLVARLALLLHAYHPLVHWLAARLRLQQELAADALGARFAGGKASYLHSLSKLALRQDGRSPYWPARAFLPARGTLIRRIAMLRDETVSMDRPWSGPRRALAALLLLVVALGVLTLRGPALGAGTDAPAAEVKDAKPAHGETGKAHVEPFDLKFIPDDVMGVVAFRASATFRRNGMGRYAALIDEAVVKELAPVAKALGIDMAGSKKSPLPVDAIDWVAAGILIDRVKTQDGKELRRFQFPALTVRTTGPFDWVKLFRACKLKPTEARDGDQVYYTPKFPILGPDCGFFCPDDRTLVLGSEATILRLIRRKVATPPPVVRDHPKDWDRVSRGLFAIALDNRDGRLAKVLRKSESDKNPEGPDVSPLFEHADRWVLGVGNSDAIAAQAWAVCRTAQDRDATAKVVESVFAICRNMVESHEPGEPDGAILEKTTRLLKRVGTNTRVERVERSVLLHFGDVGTLAEFAWWAADGPLGNGH